MPSSPRLTLSAPSRKRRLLAIIIALAAVLLIAEYGLRLGTRHGLIDLVGLNGASSSLIPPVTADRLAFPQLPAGMYSGGISDLFPGHTLPLTIISFPDKQKLTVVIGMTGWTPAIVNLNANGEEGQNGSSIKVRSNGFVLNMAGQEDAGEIRGTFTNLITKESGTWSVKPVR